jgi:lipopolysaccharide/colanic/teichoic acid biosynthesis glycosyltransferase
MYRNFFKNIIDFIFALFLIIILFPVLVILYVLVSLISGSPVIFRQKRPGKNEKIFELLKFRTMTNKTDKDGNLLSDNERITSLGKFMRRTSLDELPQLLNVLKGDISLVGPRPLLPEYLPLYNEDQKKRHLVKPGITGWAQVNGRNAISWNEKFKCDLYYVENLTFALDLKILIRTIVKVIKVADVYDTNGMTNEKFSGNSNE